MSRLSIVGVVQPECSLRPRSVLVGANVTLLYIGGRGGVLFGSACLLFFVLRAVPFAVGPSLPCYFPCISRVVLVSFARFYYSIDLASRMPCKDLWSGCLCCFARSLTLVSAGRHRQNGCVVRNPSWLRSSLSEHSRAVVTCGRIVLHYFS